MLPRVCLEAERKNHTTLCMSRLSLALHLPSDTSGCMPRPGYCLSHLRRVSHVPSHFGRTRYLPLNQTTWDGAPGHAPLSIMPYAV